MYPVISTDAKGEGQMSTADNIIYAALGMRGPPARGPTDVGLRGAGRAVSGGEPVIRSRTRGPLALPGDQDR